METRPSTEEYSNINLRLGASWNRKNTHGRHENLAEQPEGQRELWRENDKGLGLQWFYISNTRPRDDHVPSNISNHAWVDSNSSPTFQSSQLFKTMIFIQTMHEL